MKILEWRDILNKFTMENAFFIFNSSIPISQIQSCFNKNHIFRTYILAQGILYTEKKQSLKLNFSQSTQSIQELYNSNPPSLYLSKTENINLLHTYFTVHCFISPPVVEIKVTQAKDGYIFAFRFNHAVIDGTSLQYLVKSILMSSKSPIYPDKSIDIDTSFQNWDHFISKADIKQALKLIQNPTQKIRDYNYKLFPIQNSRLKITNKASISNIYIACFIKFWIINQTKSTYIFSFFVDTRYNNEIHHYGNHFIVADVAISRSIIQNYSIEKLAVYIQNQKNNKQSISPKCDIIFNSIILPPGLKIRWFPTFKNLIGYIFSKQVFIYTYENESILEIGERFKINPQKWNLYLDQHFPNKINIETKITTLNNINITNITQIVYNFNGGSLDDYDPDEALSLYGIDSVSGIQLANHLDKMCKKPISHLFTEETTINDLVNLLKANS